MDQLFDVTVIGGGINGCGIAADAALRGLSTLLIEKHDLASKTSSSSTKLIHGGLRYLEYYDFNLVKKALDERQTLIDLAPHLVTPLPIIIPNLYKFRSNWLIRLGLFLYDNLSRKNKLPKSKPISRHREPVYFSPLNESLNQGYIFYDGRADDARLTIANALQARQHSAKILTYTELVKADIQNNVWCLTLTNRWGQTQRVYTKSVINAAGPWIAEVNKILTIPDEYKMALIKGSHIVVNKLYDGDHAYLLQHQDKRVVFVIPYHGCTMIGTTDVPLTENIDSIKISEVEIVYLLELVNQYFITNLTPSDIINSWSGVRPLLASKGTAPQALSRDYTFYSVTNPAPAVTIYGGKITTYRQLAREVVDTLASAFSPLPPSVTDITPLPGAKSGSKSYAEYCRQALNDYKWLSSEILQRLLQTYGTRTELILKNCTSENDLGIHFGSGLYQCEVDYLLKEEWALTTDDILWRRTKLGLVFNKTYQTLLDNYLTNYKQNQKSPDKCLY